MAPFNWVEFYTEFMTGINIIWYSSNKYWRCHIFCFAYLIIKDKMLTYWYDGRIEQWGSKSPQIRLQWVNLWSCWNQPLQILNSISRLSFQAQELVNSDFMNSQFLNKLWPYQVVCQCGFGRKSSTKMMKIWEVWRVNLVAVFIMLWLQH